MKLHIILMFLALAGCRDVYPCDGRTVLVRPSELLDDVAHNEIRHGLHYWDVYGCSFRAEDELTDEDRNHLFGDVLYIHEWYQSSKTEAAEYDFAYPSGIMVSPNIFAPDTYPLCGSQVIAHEVGHSMGMDHVHPPQGDYAVMQPVENCIPAPTHWDYLEWCPLWCGKGAPPIDGGMD
jgi:hypothetical protein